MSYLGVAVHQDDGLTHGESGIDLLHLKLHGHQSGFYVHSVLFKLFDLFTPFISEQVICFETTRLFLMRRDTLVATAAHL